MSIEREAPMIEDENLPSIKHKKKGPKERITRLVRRINGDSIQELYEDILEENTRLKRELDKERNLNILNTREIEELRHNLLHDRLLNLSN